MQNEINYHHVKYQNGTHSDIDEVRSGETYTFVSIRGVLTCASCKEKLILAESVATNAILIEPLNQDMSKAVSDFVQKNGYLSYKIDGVVRIYKA